MYPPNLLKQHYLAFHIIICLNFELPNCTSSKHKRGRNLTVLLASITFSMTQTLITVDKLCRFLNAFV